MSSTRTLVHLRFLAGSLGIALLAGLAACSGNPTKGLLESTGFGPKMAQPQDFVVKSRQANLDYIPINDPGGGRTTPAKTADQVKQTEAELDGIRERNAAAGAVAAQAGGTPPPDPVLIPAKKTNSKPKQTTNQ